MATDDAPPMIATLVVEYADGTLGEFGKRHDWKTAIHAATAGSERISTTRAWKMAVAWTAAVGQTSEALGHPWIPDSVKALRHTFNVKSPVKSARLYATALGAYEMFLNGKRVGDQVLAPGWTDYREHVIIPDLRRDSADCATAKTRSARCWRRAGMRRRLSGFSSRTTTATRRRRCGRSCALSMRTAAWSGWRRTRAGRRDRRTFCIRRSTTARRRMRACAGRLEHGGIRRTTCVEARAVDRCRRR